MSNRENRFAKTDEWVMGIDEAGRGPVLGAMLYGACMCPKSQLEKLKATGVFGMLGASLTLLTFLERLTLNIIDSKQLTDEKRRDLFEMIKQSQYLEWIIDAIPADWMSETMIQANRRSLNEISHESAMHMIQIALDNGYNLKHVYLDTVGGPESYEQKLRSHFMGYDVRFTVSKKADALFPVVSAASICAKVTRDDILENWYFVEKNLKIPNNEDIKMRVYEEEGGEDDDDDDMKEDKNTKKEEEGCWLGNGYPGDAKTVKFMQDYCDKVFGYPNIVRFSWQTAKTIIEERCAKVSFSDEIETNNLAKWGFTSSTKVKRSKYFNDRNLSLCFENPFY